MYSMRVMHVCMCACMYVWMQNYTELLQMEDDVAGNACVCMYVCMHVCMYVMHAWMNGCKN
jgi:hypothetical protein